MPDNNIESYLSSDRLLERLETACLGLVWMSESDYPWQVVVWQDTNNLNRLLLQHCDYNFNTKIETKTLESFLEPAIIEQKWHTDVEKASIQRYQILKNLLQKNLQDIRVYLIGKVELDVYILGKSDDNRIIGLSTKIIET